MVKKRDRVRINLTVDKGIWELVQKWSYISQIPVSRLFDEVMSPHVQKFKYESEEDWLSSDEYEEKMEYEENYELPVDTKFCSVLDENCIDVTAQDIRKAGIEIEDKPQIILGKDISHNDLKRVLARKILGKDYYSRWKEVGGKGKKISDK